MATYSSNVTVKVNGAVNGGYNFVPPVPTFTTVYTAPANGYAILTIAQSGATAAFQAGSFIINFATYLTSVYVGPGQSLQVYANSGNAYGWHGVEFVNTP